MEKAQCRYLRRNDEQCTAEAAAPEADILLCTKHLSRAYRMVRAQMAALATARRTS